MGTIVDSERTCYVASFAPTVGEDLLKELFGQVGPVTKVLMKEMNNSQVRFALVEFEDEDSVLFAIETLDGIKLYNQPIVVKPRNNTKQEEKYRLAKSEIDRRRYETTQQQQSSGRDSSRRDSYDRDRNDRNRDNRQHPYRQHHQSSTPQYSVPDRHRHSSQNHQYSTPQMPHNHFINMVQRQYSAPAERQYSTPRRPEAGSWDRPPQRLNDRDSRRSYNDQGNRGGQGRNYGGGGYQGRR